MCLCRIKNNWLRRLLRCNLQPLLGSAQHSNNPNVSSFESNSRSNCNFWNSFATKVSKLGTILSVDLASAVYTFTSADKNRLINKQTSIVTAPYTRNFFPSTLETLKTVHTISIINRMILEFLVGKISKCPKMTLFGPLRDLTRPFLCTCWYQR